jgi:hypothetical protein
MRVTADFDKRILNVSGIMKDIKTEINKSLQESANIVKENIKKELRSPQKTGTIKTSRRFRSSPLRRSAPGESLARDTGRSEKLINSSNISSSKIEVGFLENPDGFNYVEHQELEKNRPTMELSIKKSIDKIQQTFEKNLQPK